MEPLRNLSERLHALVAGAMAAKVGPGDLILQVRPAMTDDLGEVARIHKHRFSDDEYTLGQYSLPMIRAFYRHFLDRCVFLVHVSEHGMDGFVLGGGTKESSDVGAVVLLAAPAPRLLRDAGVAPPLAGGGSLCIVPQIPARRGGRSPLQTRRETWLGCSRSPWTCRRRAPAPRRRWCGRSSRESAGRTLHTN